MDDAKVLSAGCRVPSVALEDDEAAEGR